MAARREPHAELRTIDLFTKKTVIEETQDMLAEEQAEVRHDGPRDIIAEAEDCAIKWLGLDVFHEGDDIKVAVHPAGHAVMVLVSARGKAPYGTSTIKLSRGQWAKLKRLASGL